MFKVGLLRYYMPFNLERALIGPLRLRTHARESVNHPLRIVRDSFERLASQKRIGAGAAPLAKGGDSSAPRRIEYRQSRVTPVEQQLLRQPPVRKFLSQTLAKYPTMPFSELARKMTVPVSPASIRQFAQKRLALGLLNGNATRVHLRRPFSQCWGKPQHSPLRREL